MSETQVESTARSTGTREWVVPSALAGLVGGVLMGIVFQANGTFPAIAALVGSSSVAVGWLVHLVISVVFGLAFGTAIAAPNSPLRDRAATTGAVVGLGVATGVLAWVVAAGLIMPLWLDAVGAAAPPLPNWQLSGLLTHLVYGVGLGASYVALRAQFAPRAGTDESESAGA